MDCREVRERLVALQDAELSPGETAQVTEHLGTCRECTARERLLARATPSHPFRANGAFGSRGVPPAALALLEDRVDVDVILAVADRRTGREERSSPWARVGPWLRRDVRVSSAGLVAYAALLALALGWGLSNWWSLSTLRGAPATAAASGEFIPADQFVPAAYDPKSVAPPLAEPHGADVDEIGGPSGEAEGGGFH